MGRRQGGGYWGGLDRPVAWCSAPGCRNTGARVSKRDGRRLCKGCRAALRETVTCKRCNVATKVVKEDGFIYHRCPTCRAVCLVELPTKEVR
jgi:phage FluMu protein Com